MKFPSPEFDDAVAALCHGTVSDGTLQLQNGFAIEDDAAVVVDNAAGTLELLHAICGGEVAVGGPGDAAVVGEAHCALGDQQHMLALAHHQPGELDRIGNILHRGHGTGTEIATVHDGGIHLDLSVLIQHRAAAGIEHRVVFE